MHSITTFGCKSVTSNFKSRKKILSQSNLSLLRFLQGFSSFNCDSSEKNKRIEFLKNLIIKCGELNIPFLEIPCVDRSAFQSDTQILEFTKINRQCRALPDENNVTIAIESSLEPTSFKTLVSSIMHPKNQK